MSLAGPIKEFIVWLVERGGALDKLENEALRAIQKAIVETKRYEEGVVRHDRIDRDHEFQLAELWNDAAAKAKLANNEMAIRLGQKARYWSDTEKWPQSKVLETGIALSALEDDVQNLLRPR